MVLTESAPVSPGPRGQRPLRRLHSVPQCNFIGPHPHLHLHAEGRVSLAGFQLISFVSDPSISFLVMNDQTVGGSALWLRLATMKLLQRMNESRIYEHRKRTAFEQHPVL